MNYQIAFWVATVVAALFFLFAIWTTLRGLKIQHYNRELFKACLTSNKVRDEALAELADLKSVAQDKPI